MTWTYRTNRSYFYEGVVHWKSNVEECLDYMTLWPHTQPIFKKKQLYTLKTHLFTKLIFTQTHLYTKPFFTWAAWHYKSPAAQLFIHQFGQDTNKEKKSNIALLALCEGNIRLLMVRSSSFWQSPFPSTSDTVGIVTTKASQIKVIQKNYRAVIVRYGHCCDVIMGAIASQIASLMIVYSTVYSDADQRKHQSFASLAFVLVIHWWPVNSPHK